METSKGPWMVEVKPTPTGQSLRIVCQNHGVVALVKNGGDHKLANANLMAAAPDLLNALELARDHLEVCNHEGEEDEALAQINAAINNAIGKAND